MLRLVTRLILFWLLPWSAMAADAPPSIDYDRALEAGRTMAEKSRAVMDQAVDQAETTRTPSLPALDLRALPGPSVDLLNLKRQGDRIRDRATAADDGDRYGGARVLVFVSSSMPMTTVRRYVAQTARIGAAVVFRGFKDNTLASMKAYLAQLFDDDAFSDQGEGLQPTVLIDPTLFSRFRVDAAPVIVALESPLKPCAADCPEPPHHRVSGDVDLGWALELIARQGASEALSGRLDYAARILRGQEPS